VINLKNNSHIFSILITSKEMLRFKDNLEASTKNVQRNLKDMFTQDNVITIDRAMLENHAFNLRKKAVMLNKQVNAYEQMTAQMNEENTASEKTEADKHDMTYIDDILIIDHLTKSAKTDYKLIKLASVKNICLVELLAHKL